MIPCPGRLHLFQKRLAAEAFTNLAGIAGHLPPATLMEPREATSSAFLSADHFLGLSRPGAFAGTALPGGAAPNTGSTVEPG